MNCSKCKQREKLPHTAICHRCDAILWAREVLKDNPLTLDTETTGIDRDAEILSIAVVSVSEAVLYSGRIKPHKPIDEAGKAFAVNKISNEMVKDAPSFQEAWESELKELLQYASVIAFNVDFDACRIQQEVRRFTYSPSFVPDFSYWKCAMKIYGQYDGTPSPYVAGQYKWHKLSDACAALGVVLTEDEAHTSLGDAIAALRVVKEISAQE